MSEVIWLASDVYIEARRRIRWCFDTFATVCVAFSGGKDSGVVLNLALDVAREIGQLSRLSVYHMDYEAQYEATTEHVERVMLGLPEEVRAYWLCLPVVTPCATSMFQSYWRPWEANKRHLWVRQMPAHPTVINETNVEFDYTGTDYDTQDAFADWLAATTGTTVGMLVGIRADESLNRRAAITSANRTTHHPQARWTARKSEDVTSCYPIYDWSVEDVWTAHAREEWPYNRLYDLFHLAGIPPHAMRVASPFIDCGQESLKLYRVIEPATWGRLVSRVNGVNFTGIYGGTTAMGWRTITKPDHFTWEQYARFLLATLPDETRARHEAKLAKSIEVWRTQGCARPPELIAEMEAQGAAICRTGRLSNYTATPTEVVQVEYMDDFDGADFKDVPSWKRVCVCILKNDVTWKYAGFARTKAEQQRRKEAINRWSTVL